MPSGDHDLLAKCQGLYALAVFMDKGPLLELHGDSKYRQSVEGITSSGKYRTVIDKYMYQNDFHKIFFLVNITSFTNYRSNYPWDCKNLYILYRGC